MPTLEESLAKIRAGGTAPSKSIEDTLSQIRSVSSARPELSFDTRDDYYNAVSKGTVRPGQLISIGDMMARATPRKKRTEKDLDFLPSEKRAKVLADIPAMGFEPIPDGSGTGDFARYKPTLEESLARVRAGKTAAPPTVTPDVQPMEIPESISPSQVFAEAGKEAVQGVLGTAMDSVKSAAAPFMPPKMPGSVMETLQMLRGGKTDVPAGPAAFTEPTALLEKSGGQAKEAVSSALKSEVAPKAGVFSKVLGKLLMAPTEAALALPPGMLSKIEDAVGEKAISPEGQEVLRQAVLSQPFTPAEFKEAIGAEGVFLGGAKAFQGVLRKFPGMAARLGVEDLGPAIQEAVKARGVKIPVSPDEMKSFFTGVGELDPALAEKLRTVSGTMDPKEFHMLVKDVLAGRKKFFVELPKDGPMPARKALPAPAEPIVAKGSVDDTLSEIRRRESLPTPGEAAKASGRSREMDPDFIKMIEDKREAGIPLSDNDIAVIDELRRRGYNIPNGPNEPIGPVRGTGDAGAGGAGNRVLVPAGPGVGPGTDVAPAGGVALSPAPAGVAGQMGASAPVGGASARAVEPGQAQGLVQGEDVGAPGAGEGGSGQTALQREARPRGGASRSSVQPGGYAEKEAPAGAVAPLERAGLSEKGPSSQHEVAPPSETPPRATTKAGDDTPPAIEMPELVELAKNFLAGKAPKVVESFRKMGIRGAFYPGLGEIRLSADIAKDPAGAAKTLAHEIGHAIDWLPDEDMAKGNILGRIGSIRKYMKHMIDALPQGGAGQISRKEVMDELIALTQKWKPFDVKANPKYTAYRHSPEELYADTVSVLFNDPGLAKELAPKFSKSWFGYLERKPIVKSSYDQVVERIRGGKVQEAREEGLEEMFEAGERQFAAERLATQKSARSAVESFRDTMIDSNEGVLAHVRRAKKAGKAVRPEDSPQYALEEMNYVSSEVKAYLEDYNQILKTLNEAGLPWRRLEHVAFHERIIHGDRKLLFNPRGFTPETSRRQLEYVKERLGKEKWAALEKAMSTFRDARMKKMPKIMRESGMFSEALMQKVENEPYHATFDVFSKNVDEAAGASGVGAAIHGQVGTLQDVSGPATATLMKDVALIKAIRRNDAARKTVGFLAREFGPSVVRPAETRFNGRYHEPVRPKGDNEALLAYMEDGKIRAFVVDKWVARTFERDPIEANVVVEAARLTQRFFREIFTQKNPGFQLFNLWRDFFRAYKNLPGMSMANLARYYAKSLTPAFRRGMDIPDPLVKEMLDKRMLITVEDKWGLSTEDEQVQALMDRYFGNRAKEDFSLKQKFLDLFGWIGNIGSAVEAMPKVAGYKYLKDHQKDLGLSDKMIAHMIRGQVGSPDFMRKGRGYSAYNTLFMFSNAIKEGWRSDIEVMRSRPGEYAWKTVKSNLVSKLLMFGAAAGLMGAGMKDMMDGVPEYDKTNYFVLPLGKTPQGRTVYFRLPQDEAGRFLSGLFWKVLNRQADPTELADYMAGQAPTLNPILGVVADTVQYAAGKNPYDFFRQRNVIADKEFEAGGWRSHRLFLKHLANSMGSGIVHTFKTNDLQKIKSEMEEVLGFPILSNIIGRFVKASDYGKAEMIQREVKKSRRETAREGLDERDALVRHLNAVDRPSLEEAGKLYSAMMKDGMLKRGRGTGVVGLSEFLKEYNRFAAKREADPYMNALVYAKTNEERADLLAYYRKTLPKAEYDQIVSKAVSDGLMTAKPLILSFIEEKK